MQYIFNNVFDLSQKKTYICERYIKEGVMTLIFNGLTENLGI